MEHYHAVIMAGGGGTRLWPLSRQHTPKQMIKLLGDRTLFQIAVERLAPLFPPEQIWVVTTASYANELQRECPYIPGENFVLEPKPRGTAAAIGLTAHRLHQRDPQAVMACLTADHFIGNEAGFRAVLAAAGQVAQDNHLVTLGIRPTFPSTGYGYIQRGEALSTVDRFDVFHAARFKEKPALPEAEAMLADGLHTWNSGMFIWRTERILAEFQRQMPDFYTRLQAMAADPNQFVPLWEDIKSETIDYGIMEQATDVAVIPVGDLEWNDVGSWDALFDVLKADEQGNILASGQHLNLNSTGTLVHSTTGRLIATIGVSDLVIVDTGDALLVCPRHLAQEVKKVVERLKRDNQVGYL